MDQSKLKCLVLISLIFLPVVFGCAMPAPLLWIIQQAEKAVEEEPRLVEMTAKGNIVGPNEGYEWGGGTLTGSEITLHWNVDERKGETLSRVWGEGFSNFYASNGCPDGPNEIKNQLTFTGTVSADGITYSGVVNFKVSDLCGLTINEYPAGWWATRVGDYIEGEIDRQGAFTLKVQPALED